MASSHLYGSPLSRCLGLRVPALGAVPAQVPQVKDAYSSDALSCSPYYL
jgi:hypothetical protein